MPGASSNNSAYGPAFTTVVVTPSAVPENSVTVMVSGSAAPYKTTSPLHKPFVKGEDKSDAVAVNLTFPTEAVMETDPPKVASRELVVVSAAMLTEVTVTPAVQDCCIVIAKWSGAAKSGIDISITIIRIFIFFI
jgi:hypothetical protein